jgi:hypothetical protein
VVERELAPVEGEDLAFRLAAHDTGDRATDRGVIIPLTLDESCDCRILFQLEQGDEAAPPLGPLEVRDDRVIVTTMEALRFWSPVRARLVLDLPSGWYSVRALSGPGDDDADGEAELTMTLTFTPTSGPIRRTADLDLRLAADGTRRTPGMVSIWTGRFGNQESLREHLSVHRPDSGPPGSPFMKATGLGWYEEDQCSTVWWRQADDTHVMRLPEGDFAEAAESDLSRRPHDDAAVLLYDLDARDLPKPSDSTPLRLLGVYRYR